jgi:hypothetical protein
LGHQRLGTLPKSFRWNELVSLLFANGEESASFGDEDVTAVIETALRAADGALSNSVNDPGLRYTYYLLTQLALASRHDDWRRRLTDLGVVMGPDADATELVVSVQAAIDDYLFEIGSTSDIASSAQEAAGEAILNIVAPKAHTLFGTHDEDLQLALRSASTKTGFSSLAHSFFAGFLWRFLNFYVSRASASATGIGKIEQVGDLTRFNDALTAHCRQSAEIVRPFAGEWYSKTEYEQGITPENSGGFVAVAIGKLRAELGHQERNG